MAEIPKDVMSYLAPSNTSVYDHLAQVLTAISIDERTNPELDPEERFRKVSREVLEDTLQWRNEAPPMKVDLTAQTQSRDLFKKHKPVADPASAVLSKPTVSLDTYLPDCAREMELLAWSGVAIGDAEMCKVEAAMRQLAAQHPELKSLRFFGKMLALDNDYYVAEGEQTAPDEFPPAGLANPYHPQRRELDKAIHHNKLKYYVCVYPGAAWTALPNVRAQQLQEVEKTKKLLTGSLSAAVSSYPPFPGETEAELLRAKIALVASQTVLSPNGYFKEVPPDPEAKRLLPSIQAAADWAPPEDKAALLTPANWTRHYPAIPDRDEVPEDFAPDEEGKWPELEPEAWPLRPIEEVEGKPTWFVRQCGSHYRALAPVALYSLEFPGAVVVAQGGRFCSFYHGWGNRETFNTYTPSMDITMVMPPVCKDDKYRVHVPPPAESEEGAPPPEVPPPYPQEGWKVYNEEQEDLHVQMKTEWPELQAAEGAAGEAPPAEGS